MKRHTGIYVDVAYKDSTKIVVIKDDSVLDIITLVPQTEFEEVRDNVIFQMKKHNIDHTKVKSRGYPLLEQAIARSSPVKVIE